MANLNNFDANTVNPMVEFEPVPAGEYLAVITNSEQKSNSKGTGHYLELTFQIVEGEYEGRNLWTRLNLDNPSDMAVTIARAELSSICRAVGVMNPNDSVELHDIPLVVKVKCVKRKDNGEITNEIKGYASKNNTPPSHSQAASGKTPPWSRNQQATN